MIKPATTKRIRRRVGDIVSVPLGGDRVAFGWVLEEPLMAFLDYSCDASAPVDIDVIARTPILFRICVMNSAITGGRWAVVGRAPVPSNVLVAPWFFKKDPISGRLSITQTGAEEIPADAARCRLLERAAVWEPEHVEDRLRDGFAGVPNKWVESMRLRD